MQRSATLVSRHPVSRTSLRQTCLLAARRIRRLRKVGTRLLRDGLCLPAADVGTRLYVAPEVFSGRSKARSQAKADMYSLGICFFEMNYKFSTGAERIHVIEDLRKPQIIFPTNWPAGRERQKQSALTLEQVDLTARILKPLR